MSYDFPQVPVTDKERQTAASVLVKVLGERMGLWDIELTIVAFGIEEKLKSMGELRPLGEQRLKSWIVWDYEVGRTEGQPRAKFYVDLSKNVQFPGVWFVRGDASNIHGKTFTVVCSSPV
jgi:hypothetical protein